jgi:hypothetical protein
LSGNFHRLTGAHIPGAGRDLGKGLRDTNAKFEISHRVMSLYPDFAHDFVWDPRLYPCRPREHDTQQYQSPWVFHPSWAGAPTGKPLAEMFWQIMAANPQI